jgi:hypothetical protein
MQVLKTRFSFRCVCVQSTLRTLKILNLLLHGRFLKGSGAFLRFQLTAPTVALCFALDACMKGSPSR